jgi:anhydro-N-acetylmuramic acid kinase
VPFGDSQLFSNYDYCLNLGGIANITLVHAEPIRAFDICPANMALNQLISESGPEYDDRGTMASSGQVNETLLDRLNKLDFYRLEGPKSLGREWFDTEFLPLIRTQSIPLPDRLRTCVEHVAIQISSSINSSKKKVLATGGGALNDFLIERIKALSASEIVLPEKKMIEFKEAYVFAFLGLMRNLELENAWSSITGASRSSSGGGVYLP